MCWAAPSAVPWPSAHPLLLCASAWPCAPTQGTCLPPLQAADPRAHTCSPLPLPRRHAQVQRRLHACNMQALANIAWALATLRYRPRPAWTAAFMRTVLRRLRCAGVVAGWHGWLWIVCKVSTLSERHPA